jgi:RNA polymerase sigma-70 factor (ECF subfamily)
MLPLNPDSVLDLSLLSAERQRVVPRAADEEVLLLFDRCASSLLRYVASFGLPADEAEDVVQEVFLALFRHLRLDRSRRNLTGWLFRVAHNLALKRRKRLQRRTTVPWDDAVHAPVDPAPVIQALPPRDRRCLLLRAEGLRYRDIADTLGMSLGGVAKSLARSVRRLLNADKG